MRPTLLASCVLLAAVLTWVGCQSSGSVDRTGATLLPELAASSSGLTSDELERARQLSLVKCVRCHKLYNPARYSDAEWQSWMAKMGRKARLKSEDAELLSRYFNAYRPHQ